MKKNSKLKFTEEETAAQGVPDAGHIRQKQSVLKVGDLPDKSSPLKEPTDSGPKLHHGEAPKGPPKLQHGEKPKVSTAAASKPKGSKKGTQKKPSKVNAIVSDSLQAETCQAIRKNNEDENVAVEAAQRGEELGSTVTQDSIRVVKQIRAKRSSPNKRDQSIKEANIQQKQAIKKSYARKKTQELQENPPIMVRLQTFIENVGQTSKKAVATVRRRPKSFIIVLAMFILLSMLLNMASSCSIIIQGVSSILAGTTYPSRDEDMLAAESEYCAMENNLRQSLQNYELTHNYDEYMYKLDDINHDPYVLISTITALRGGPWSIDEVHDTLAQIFDQQYTLTEEVSTQMKPDPNNPNAPPQPFVTVRVTLKNNILSHIQANIMTEQQLASYATYMSTLGNREDLFPGSEYIGRYGEGSYITYDIPPSAMRDETFAAMIKEAEKYLGYPYVWGGSSPETSFDCSGFVCWVLNHSGWNVGRTTAQGLCNFCTPVRESDARPGDLVFFIGTYDTDEVSHVGIYVGNNMMIQCGDPITYSNLNSTYWQNHLYCYGRLP